MSKRTKIHLSDTLSFSTDIITEVIDLIAKRGAGKTYAATKLAEEMLLVGAQVVVVDPVGNWYGLRLGSDGKPSDGLDIKILGGRTADIPLEHTAGALVAKTIVETGMSAILDVSMFSKAKQRRFITDFSVAMLEFRKRDPAAMHIFWEEAYRFMPQKMAKGSKNEMLEATEELVTMGRNFGIGGTIICQRSAQISKTALTQASILLAMNTTGLADRKLIEAWVEYHNIDNQKLELSSLAKGEAYVWWPEEFGLKRVKVAKKRTYDASSTPKFGETTRRRKLKKVDLDALQVSMAETIEKAKAEDPKLLRLRIVELEKMLAAKPKEAAPTIVEVPVVSDEHFQRLDKAIDDAKGVSENLLQALSLAAQKPINDARMRPKVSVALPAARRPEVKQTECAGDLTNPEQKILDALAWMESIGVDNPLTTAVAMLAKYRPTSGGFNNLRGKLKAKGLIDYSIGKRMCLTGEGRIRANPPREALTTEVLQEKIFEKISGPEGRLLRPLIEAWPHSMSTEELADAAGYSASSGGFNNLRGRLRTLGIIDYPGKRSVRACNLMFLGDE